MRTIAFFNNKGGVGKTSLVYHLAWMFADLDVSVVAADLDPQANLSSMFLDEPRLEELWPEVGRRSTVFGALRPLVAGTGDIDPPHVEPISDRLGLVVGDLALGLAEDDLSSMWPLAGDGKERAFRVLSALWRILQSAGVQRCADVALIDVGPSLGALNRAALIAADQVVVPLAPDLYSLQGLRNLGPRLQSWRTEWAERRGKNPAEELDLPLGSMTPIGYVVMQHAERKNRPTKAYAKWIDRVPDSFATNVLQQGLAAARTVENDINCLATLKHYRSLMPLAQEARKPMFHLGVADGALGGHAQAVRTCYQDFRRLALTIAQRATLVVPGP